MGGFYGIFLEKLMMVRKTSSFKVVNLRVWIQIKRIKTGCNHCSAFLKAKHFLIESDEDF